MTRSASGVRMRIRVWVTNMCVVMCTVLGCVVLTTPSQAKILSELPNAVGRELRLVMVEVPGCPFCLRWQQQVGFEYHKSSEGKKVPLVRVMFGAKSLSGYKNLKVTPTFLVLQGAEELGRITGYPGRDAFWDELNKILKSIKTPTQANTKDAP